MPGFHDGLVSTTTLTMSSDQLSLLSEDCVTVAVESCAPAGVERCDIAINAAC